MLDTHRGWETLTWSIWPLKKYVAPSECVQVSVCNHCFIIGRSWQCVTRRELSSNKVYKQSRSCFSRLKIFTLRLKHTLIDTDSLAWKYDQYSVINMRISVRNLCSVETFLNVHPQNCLNGCSGTHTYSPANTNVLSKGLSLEWREQKVLNRPGTLVGT